jgi:Leucine-rich repeat (LRR) protein
LDVADNRVVDLKPLSSLKKLTWLRAENNKIVDISPLAGLVDLNYVGLSGNRITDCTALAGFKQLAAVDISDNPIPESQLDELRKSLPKLIFWNGEDIKSRVVKGAGDSRQGAKAQSENEEKK